MDYVRAGDIILPHSVTSSGFLGWQPVIRSIFSLIPLPDGMKAAVLKWFPILHGCNWAGMHW